MDQDHSVSIGNRYVWGGEQPFALRRADRRHHTYIVGQTGSGKTTLLRNLILQDIAAGEGVGVIDPHGDLANDLLDYIPTWRTDEVVYFDPSDFDYPISLNLLANVPSHQRHLVTSGIIAAFKGIWGDSWGPRMEYILANAVAALTECSNVTLLSLQRLLTDEPYRQRILRQVEDPAVLQFWHSEFASWDARFRAEAVAPIQNKIGQLLLAPPIRNILGQVKRKVDARFMMDRGRILIANLSKGKIGADKCNLFGALLVAQFQLAAMSRAKMAEHERRDFYMFIDEFHNFATDAYAEILSESRKYRLCLTLSHQYTAQLHEKTKDAIFGNVGTLISFRVGDADAALLGRQFGGRYSASYFTELGNFEVCARMLVDGEQREPFTGRTVFATGKRHGNRDNLIRRSRERYATPRHLVEDKIRRWMRG